MPIIKCIYCLNLRESSREHVVPYSLGGNLTIPWVCEVCNNGFSEIDQSLSEESLLILPRLAEQPGIALSKSLQIENEIIADKNLEVRMESGFTPITKAQLSFLKLEAGKYQIQGGGDSVETYRDLFKQLKKLKSKGKLYSIKISTPFNEKQSIPKLVLNRSNSVIFRPPFQCLDVKSEFEAIINFLDKSLSQIEESFFKMLESAPRERVDNPTVVFNLSIDFGKNLRAVSKIAFNYLAYLLGPEYLYDTKFDRLREYIKKGIHADDEGSYWQNQGEFGTRYSMWIPDHCQSDISLSEEDVHVIMLNSVPDRFLMFIEFFGQTAFVIDVGELTSNKIQLLPIAHDFNYKNKTNYQLSPHQIIERVTKRMIRGK